MLTNSYKVSPFYRAFKMPITRIHVIILTLQDHSVNGNPL